MKTVVNTTCHQIDQAPEVFELGSKEPCADLPVGRRKTLLLVDDEDAIRHIGQQLLEDKGYKVLLAKDGREAVEVYSKNKEQIDLVLLDIVMPNMGGSEAFDCLREINKDVKVLVWSGANVDDVATSMLNRGCRGFMHKPFSIKRLSERIKEIIDEE